MEDTANISDLMESCLAAKFNVYKIYAEKMLLAERMRLLGDSRNQSVWFDNHNCEIYVPNALDDRIQSLIVSTAKFFEEPLLRRVMPYIKKGSTVLDIGANIGNHTVFFSAVCKAGKVISFEPQKRVFELLARNVELNSSPDRINEIHNIGLGNKNHRLSIVHENQANYGATQFAYDESGGFEVKRLDDLNVGKVDFVKIDVERMGHEVLAGGLKLLSDNDPVVWIELYGEEIEPSREIFKELGYSYTENMTGADYLFSKNPL